MRSGITIPFFNPVQINSAGGQQFRITKPRDSNSGGASFAISVAQRTTFAGTNPLNITSPVQFASFAQLASTHASQTTLAARATMQYDVGINTFVAIATANIGGIAHIVDSAGLADGFEIRLPAGALATAQSAINDTIDTIIINNTPKTAKIALIDAINDTMAPLDDSGEILIAARSQFIATCIFLEASAPTMRANYLIGRYGAPTGGGGGGMVVAANIAAFPPVGDAATVYVAADTNKIYRYQMGITPSGYDWTIGPSGDFPNLQSALASMSVLDGHKLYMQNGVYPITTTLTIAKQVQIFGQSRADVVLASLGTGTDPVTLVSITADNVVLRGLTIRHQKTTSTSLECAIAAMDGTNNISGLIVDDCIIEYMKHAFTIRASNWKIANSIISYVGANTSTKRALYVYATAGTSFITNNRFLNNTSTGNMRTIMLSLGVGTDAYTGTLVIEDNMQTGLQTIFFIQDSLLGSPGGFNVVFKRNRANETSVFASFWCSAVNGGDNLGQVVSEGNIMSNASGKCAITLETSGAFSFRTSALPIHVSGNTLANLFVGALYTLSPGASDYSCAYTTASVPASAVVQDSIIPASPIAPATPTIWSAIDIYREMSPMPQTYKMVSTILSPSDLLYLDLAHLAQANALVVFRNRLALHLGIDYYLSTVALATRITWTNAIAVGGAEQLVVGDRISVIYIADS